LNLQLKIEDRGETALEIERRITSDRMASGDVSRNSAFFSKTKPNVKTI
jgi:hypothetical protein